MGSWVTVVASDSPLEGAGGKNLEPLLECNLLEMAQQPIIQYCETY